MGDPLNQLRAIFTSEEQPPKARIEAAAAWLATAPGAANPEAALWALHTLSEDPALDGAIRVDAAKVAAKFSHAKATGTLPIDENVRREKWRRCFNMNRRVKLITSGVVTGLAGSQWPANWALKPGDQFNCPPGDPDEYLRGLLKPKKAKA